MLLLAKGVQRPWAWLIFHHHVSSTTSCLAGSRPKYNSSGSERETKRKRKSVSSRRPLDTLFSFRFSPLSNRDFVRRRISQQWPLIRPQSWSSNSLLIVPRHPVNLRVEFPESRFNLSFRIFVGRTTALKRERRIEELVEDFAR